MSRSSDSVLNATDSQDLGSLDSISVPSEPPDIRNWFSSYVYESPELNTLDGFQNFDGSAENFLDEEVKAKLAENRNFRKHDDGAGQKESDDAVVKSNKDDEFEHIKPAAAVSGLSESVALCSEPPNIKNWFSSYVYESPPLDSTDAFMNSDYKEREDDGVHNDRGTCIDNYKDVENFTEGAALLDQSEISSVVLKCTNLVKDTKLDNQHLCKDGQNLDLKPNFSTLPHKTSERVSEQILPELITQNQNHGLAEKFGNTNQLCEDYDAKFSYKFIDRTHRSLNPEKGSGSPDRKSLYKSIERKDCIEDGLVKEALHENVSPRTIDLVVLERNSKRRPTTGSIGKENEDTEVLENGFVSTRKNSRRTNSGNIGMPSGVRLESQRNIGKPEFDSMKDALVSRKVLSETTNIHSSSVVESTGKWRCPQKSKPNLGPPLKQLRLEQWVRRV